MSKIEIVVDGNVFTSYTTEESRQATLTEAGYIKCPWCGAESDDTYIWSLGTESGKWNIEAGIYSITDSSSDFTEHSCIECGKPIELPEGL